MTNYTELVKALRGKFIAYDVTGNHNSAQLYKDAAAAIEELDAEETRLLLLTSDLQDKLMDLQEQLNDADVAAEDDRRQIEELQAEVKRLQLDNEDYEYEHRRLKGEIEALKAELEKKRTADCWGCKCEKVEQKRGEWIDGDARRVTARCSVCGHLRLGNGAEWANKHVHFCEVCGSRMGGEKE